MLNLMHECTHAHIHTSHLELKSPDIQTSKAEALRQTTQTNNHCPKGSHIILHKAPCWRPMTQFCSRLGSGECPECHQGTCCLSESARPRKPQAQTAQSPVGSESSWRIYSQLQISSHHATHLPQSNSTANITQPRKMPSVLSCSAGSSQLLQHRLCPQSRALSAPNCI